MSDYETLTIREEGPIRWVTISAPPMNVMTPTMFGDLVACAADFAADPDVVVAVFDSADPDFFIAHFDVSSLTRFDRSGEPPRATEPSQFTVMCEHFRTGPFVSIAKIAGRVGGGGAEVAAAMDMRFGSTTTVLNQMEVPLGIIPGGGGTQRIPALVGRGRALEIICGAIDVDAATLERWGWLNRALPGDELDAHVDALARRMASFPPTALRAAKTAVLAALADPLPGLLVEEHQFAIALRSDEAPVAMNRFLERGGQTREVELEMERVSGELGPW